MSEKMFLSLSDVSVSKDISQYYYIPWEAFFQQEVHITGNLQIQTFSDNRKDTAPANETLGQAFPCNRKSTDPAAHTSAKSVPYAPSGARTLDTLIKSQVLYQLS